MAYLEAINGPLTGTQYPLDRPRLRLGRHPNCDVVLDSGGSVSRYHAEITEQGDLFFVQDSNSRNGTFVNGRMIAKRERLYDDDRVQICDLVFVFHDARPAARRPATEGTFPISAVLVDESDPTSSSIMSRLEVSSAGRHLHVQTSADVKLQAMIELAEGLAKSLSVDDVLPPVLDSLFKIFLQADQGFIVLVNDDGKWEPRCTRFRRPSGDHVRISRSIIDHVMAEREAIISADAADDSRFELSESIANFRIRSFMCVPLIDAENRVLGALQIDAVDSQTRFGEKDLELGVSVASQAAIAIQRARLHDEAMQTRAIQAELDLARQVQLSVLPEEKPVVPGYEFYDYYRAANTIGGDYFDYVQLPDGRLAAIVADVSGHGIAAAMVMARLASETKFCLATIDDPCEVMSRINNLLCVNNSDGRFVTMVLVVLDPRTHELTILNAGHSSPLLRHPDGRVESLPRDHAGMILGVLEDTPYEAMTHALAPGNSITLFTDGIVEAMHPDGSQYGDERLAKQLSHHPSAEVSVLGEQIIRDVGNFIGNGVQTDDICLVSLRRLA